MLDFKKLNYEKRMKEYYNYDNYNFEVGEKEAYELGYATKENERWFDFESFGNDLLDNSRYHELSDCRIVLLSE